MLLVRLLDELLFRYETSIVLKCPKMSSLTTLGTGKILSDF